jgi:acetate kinase
MSRSIAVINAGSSSVKFALYDTEMVERCSFRGQVEGIGVKPRLKVADADGRAVEERDVAAKGFDHGAAMRQSPSGAGEEILNAARSRKSKHRSSALFWGSAPR